MVGAVMSTGGAAAAMLQVSEEMMRFQLVVPVLHKDPAPAPTVPLNAANASSSVCPVEYVTTPVVAACASATPTKGESLLGASL